MPEPLLENHVILVTGSTTGIGRAIARRCVAEGARVMIHGRRERAAQQLRQELGEAAGHVLADLADTESPQRIMDAVIDRFGRIDGLVNNAALTTRSNLDTVDSATFDRILAVNLKAPLFLIQAAMPHFRAQGRGVVLNIGSINALGGERNLLPYSVSKGGLMTMTRNLADAHAHEQVRINQLNVGWTLTEGEQQTKQEDGLPPDWETQLPERYAPSGRIFRPEEIAAHAVFWLSDEAGPVSGSVYEIEQYPMVGRNPEKEI
jgi:NAD(P)-dependent dehydrogenase (short-subunit alcohol dehydrogenase family)